MPVLHLSQDHFKREYGILCHRYFPRQALATPFGGSYCVVGPAEATDPHQHHEGETFYIVRGRGEMAIEGEATALVAAGDVVYLPAHANHELRNLSATEDLAFFSVWWDDGTAQSATLPAHSLIIAAPPTPNGDLHLGHLSGPYVAADIYARYLRSRRVDVRVACGSDDNQSYTATKAVQLGLTPAAVTERFATAIEGTLAGMAVDIDYFLRPTRTPAYGAYVQAFLAQLLASGAVVRQAAPSLWCTPCGMYLYEAHVAGGCPHCQAPTSGNGCEACYRPNDCADLLDPRCVHCQTPATREVRERLYFPLEPHRAVLEAFYADVAMAPHLRALADTLLAGPLPAVSVSHLAGWGIPVPDAPGEVIYEWFEMAAAFLFQAEQVELPQAFTQGEVVQFFGFDNSFFFLTFLPAVLRAHDPAVRLPRALVTNEFYLLEGQKFSTSRRHAIWGDEALAHVPADVLRFGLAWDRPEVAQTSFSLPGFEAVIRRELVDGWEGWLAELDARVDGQPVPALGPLSAAQQAFAARLEGYARELAACYDAADFSPRRAARRLGALVADARDFGQAHAHARHGTALALELAAARQFASLAYPLTPAFATRLALALGDDLTPRWRGQAEPLPAGRQVARLDAGTFAAAFSGIQALANARLARQELS
ncbi:MAG: Methionine--tRNA ligase [Cyanobacteria bacterium RYN_339]|nr:Methionine--tRNA ligase [Cyanobacteria bacterium RYN_339]